MSASVFCAKGFAVGLKLRLSEKLRNEWQVRGIGDVITELDGYQGEKVVMVDHAVAKQIADDCRFYLDPKAVDATAGERSAYRGLLKAIQAATGSAQ